MTDDRELQKSRELTEALAAHGRAAQLARRRLMQTDDPNRWNSLARALSSRGSMLCLAGLHSQHNGQVRGGQRLRLPGLGLLHLLIGVAKITELAAAITQRSQPQV